MLIPVSSSAGGLWTTIKISIIKLFSRKPELHLSALVWFLSATVADVLITGTLVINLVCAKLWVKICANVHDSQSRRKTGFSATDDAISRIIRSGSSLNLCTNMTHCSKQWRSRLGCWREFWAATWITFVFLLCPVPSLLLAMWSSLWVSSNWRGRIDSRYSFPFVPALPVRKYSEHLWVPFFWGPTFGCTANCLVRTFSHLFMGLWMNFLFSRNFIWDLALTKLYANCLLSTLNARADIKESTSHQSGQCHQISTTGGASRRAVRFCRSHPPSPSWRCQPIPIFIRILT